MSRQRMIVGLADAVLSESGDAPVAAGLAVEVALAAVTQGHRGSLVSRLGQDGTADELLALLRDASVDVAHLQTDPDLPTGRVTRRILGRSNGAVEGVTPAFANLQWDYDLVDLAQQSDIVVAGLAAAQHGQTRMVMQQFLHECGNAVRVADLTDMTPDIERRVAEGMLESCDVAVIDQARLDRVAPAPDDEARAVRLSRLMRDAHLSLVIWTDDASETHPMTLYHADGATTMSASVAPDRRVSALVAMLIEVVRGGEAQACADAADAVLTSS